MSAKATQPLDPRDVEPAPQPPAPGTVDANGKPLSERGQKMLQIMLANLRDPDNHPHLAAWRGCRALDTEKDDKKNA